MAETETVVADPPIGVVETPPVVAPDAPPDAQPPAVIREVEHRDFVETFTIRENGKKYEAAANALANKAKMQVNVAKLRALGEKVIAPFMEEGATPPTPKEFKIIAESFAVIDGMAESAYGDSKGGNKLANALERLAYGMTRGAMDGARIRYDNNAAKVKRLENMRRVGSSPKKKDETIEIAPAQ